MAAPESGKHHETSLDQVVQRPLGSTAPEVAPARRGSGRLQPAVETGNRPAQVRGGSPQEKRAALRPVVEAVAAHARSSAVAFPPASLGAGGRTQENKSRTPRCHRPDSHQYQCPADRSEKGGRT